MMMLECDAKQLLASVGVNVPAGTVWRRGAAAGGVTVDHYPVAVKAQVRSGGRGKQGGVVKVADRAALEAAAKAIDPREDGVCAIAAIRALDVDAIVAGVGK